MLAVDGEIVDDQLVDSGWAPNSVSRRKEHTATSLETVGLSRPLCCAILFVFNTEITNSTHPQLPIDYPQ